MQSKNPESVSTRKKTYKREVAFLLLLWLFYLSIWGSVEVLTVLVWPVFVYVLGAYGLDETSKNILPNISSK